MTRTLAGKNSNETDGLVSLRRAFSSLSTILLATKLAGGSEEEDVSLAESVGILL